VVKYTTLCLYTANFPYGMGEQFIETEILYLSKSFEKVFIIPCQITGEKRLVPENVQIIIPDYSRYSTKKGLKCLGRWTILCLKDILKTSQKKMAISGLLQIGYCYVVMHSLLKKHNLLNDNVLHFSYWFDENSTILSILKSKQLLNQYISRAHGFDLYEDRRKENFIPYRKLQLKYVDKLYLISNDGLNYIMKKYPPYSKKFDLSYLGISNNNPFHYIGKSEKYVIVSCSRIVDIKRVDLTIKTLALIKHIPIKWVHFGDGDLFEFIINLAKKKLPENIKADFKGHVDNQTIYQFYKNNNIDCFLNMSSSEGLPVGIMEAISFGIPVIATNVGGTAEIVKTQTGTLLEEDFNLEEAKMAIIDVLYNKSNNLKFREGVYKFWKENFNADKNYPDFIEKIKKV